MIPVRYLSVVLITVFIITLNNDLSAFSEKGDCMKCHKLTHNEARDILKDGIPDPRIINISPSPVRGIWEVVFEAQGRKGIVYIDYTKRFVFAGNIFDVAKKINLTQERFTEINRIDISKIDLKDALIMGNKGAKNKVIIFHDPD